VLLSFQTEVFSNSSSIGTLVTQVKDITEEIFAMSLRDPSSVVQWLVREYDIEGVTSNCPIQYSVLPYGKIEALKKASFYYNGPQSDIVLSQAIAEAADINKVSEFELLGVSKPLFIEREESEIDTRYASEVTDWPLVQHGDGNPGIYFLLQSQEDKGKWTEMVSDKSDDGESPVERPLGADTDEQHGGDEGDSTGGASGVGGLPPKDDDYDDGRNVPDEVMNDLMQKHDNEGASTTNSSETSDDEEDDGLDGLVTQPVVKTSWMGFVLVKLASFSKTLWSIPLLSCFPTWGGFAWLRAFIYLSFVVFRSTLFSLGVSWYLASVVSVFFVVYGWLTTVSLLGCGLCTTVLTWRFVSSLFVVHPLPTTYNLSDWYASGPLEANYVASNFLGSVSMTRFHTKSDTNGKVSTYYSKHVVSNVPHATKAVWTPESRTLARLFMKTINPIIPRNWAPSLIPYSYMVGSVLNSFSYPEYMLMITVLVYQARSVRVCLSFKAWLDRFKYQYATIGNTIWNACYLAGITVRRNLPADFEVDGTDRDRVETLFHQLRS